MLALYPKKRTLSSSRKVINIAGRKRRILKNNLVTIVKSLDVDSLDV